MALDFTGSDPQVRAALNLPTGSMPHHPFLAMALVNFVVTRSEAIHINAGILRPIDLVLPEASVVNAAFPAACDMRFTTAMRVHDFVLGALTRAIPGDPGRGAGRRRGRPGGQLCLEIRHPSAVVVMRGKERQRFTSWDAQGGGVGAASGCIGLRPGRPPHDIGKRTVYRPEMGEVIRLWGGGGGGFGEPLDRDSALVAEDVAAGLVSPERTREVYGVVPGDAAATAALRQRLLATRSAADEFDFGAARRGWERLHGRAAERIAAARDVDTSSARPVRSPDHRPVVLRPYQSAKIRNASEPPEGGCG